MNVVTIKTRRARALRKVENDAEDRLWIELRNRRLNGCKFVRQLPVGRYFADFACREAKLIIEVDGSQHAGSRYDEVRNAFMTAQGWSVLRFWNVDMFKEIDAVQDTILAAVEGRLIEKVEAFDLRFYPADRVY
jgi:very-short-patch-repair endonuclease